MKLRSLIFLLWTLVVASCNGMNPAYAQVQSGSGGRYVFGTVSGTGAVGGANSYISYLGQPFSPATHGIDWSNAGTAASACTFQVEGSSDAVNWHPLTASTDCTSLIYAVTIANQPVCFLRVRVLTYTAGDGTTAVKFTYTRGVN